MSRDQPAQWLASPPEISRTTLLKLVGLLSAVSVLLAPVGDAAASEIVLSRKTSLYSMAPDGASSARLDSKVGGLDYFVLSSDGGRLAFKAGIRRRSHFKPGIVVQRPDGSGRTYVTGFGSSDGASYPVEFSPDGRLLLVAKNSDLYVFDWRKGGKRRLTDTPEANEYSAAFSPDSQTVAFARGNSSSLELFSIRSDGSDERLLVNALVQGEPAWSPSGGDILFTRGSGSTSVIARVSSTGGIPVDLTDPSLKAHQGSYSPDGARLLYRTETILSEPRVPGGVFVANADGSNPVPLNGEYYSDLNRWLDPTFSPDGSHVAYLSDCNCLKPGRPQLHVVNPDGTENHRLGEVDYYGWRP